MRITDDTPKTDDLKVRAYKRFLKRFNDLLDCSWFWYEDWASPRTVGAPR